MTRWQGRGARPKFALLTAFPDEAGIEAAEALGAVVIPKPVSMASLVEIVSDLLRGERADAG